jgi:hypothetical protein
MLLKRLLPSRTRSISSIATAKPQRAMMRG